MNLFEESIRIIKNNQAETGAYIASPGISVYQYSWFRDGSWIAYAMLIADEKKSAEKFYDWSSKVIIKYEKKILDAIKNSEERKSIGENFIHARYSIYGEEVNEKWGEFQLDGLGVWLWSLSQFIEHAGREKIEWIKSAGLVCDYLKKLWNIPCNDIWEENPEKIHTSVLASIYAGLSSFSSKFPEKNLEKTCNNIKEFILNNLVYKDSLIKYFGSKEVDSGILMCAVPFNIFSAKNALIKKTAKRIVNELHVTQGLKRYKDDTFYGGGEWIILACWLGLFYIEINKFSEAKKILKWVEDKADKNFYLPEQINPASKTYYKEWVEKWGAPANPLLWSHAMYIILNNKFLKTAL